MKESQYYNPRFDEVAKGLVKKIGIQKCPHCDIKKDFNPSTFRLPFDDSPDMKPEEFGRHFPFVALQCPNCGHTDFYDAQIMGVIKKNNE